MVEAQSLNYWTAREVPINNCFLKGKERIDGDLTGSVFSPCPSDGIRKAMWPCCLSAGGEKGGAGKVG